MLKKDLQKSVCLVSIILLLHCMKLQYKLNRPEAELLGPGHIKVTMEDDIHGTVDTSCTKGVFYL